MYRRIISVVSNKYILAAILTIVLVSVLPDYFSKYSLELLQTEINTDSRVYYQDLDGDGFSERIQYYHNTLNKACYMIHTSDGDLLDQFNFNGDITSKEGKFLWFFDIDNNGMTEIYNTTQRHDSVFLNIQEPFVDNGLNQKDIFIDTITPYDGKYEANECKKAALIGSEEKASLVFSFNVGFGANPRNMYIYNPSRKVVKKSPHLVNMSCLECIEDINRDGHQDIIIRNHSSGNSIDSIYTKRSDYSSWLTVLDSNLQLLFDPVEFKFASSVWAFPITYNGIDKLVVWLNSKRESEYPDKLIRFDAKGNSEKEVVLPNTRIGQLFFDEQNEWIIHYDRAKGIVTKYDLDFKRIEQITLETSGSLSKLKFNDNSKELWTQYHLVEQRFTVYDQDFSNPISLNIPFQLRNPAYVDSNITKEEYLIHLHHNETSFLFRHEENPLYVFQFIIYLLIYTLFLSLIWLIQKGQQIRLEKQHAIETEIAELQLKTIKNQVDPHFVFNAINTISEMTLMDDKLEADALISRFSGFMRDTLKHSDKISTSLGEELSYVENFIKLQQLRFMNTFNYKIEVDEAIDLTFLVPKHVLFTYVENAIKHSLALAKNGQLEIHINETRSDLIMKIENKGLAMTLSSKAKGTGNGLRIMERIFNLYTKRFGRVITSKTEAVNTNKGEIGQRVTIYIAKTKKNE